MTAAIIVNIVMIAMMTASPPPLVKVSPSISINKNSKTDSDNIVPMFTLLYFFFFAKLYIICALKLESRALSYSFFQIRNPIIPKAVTVCVKHVAVFPDYPGSLLRRGADKRAH
jgi:hypothetical protein